MPPRPDLSGPRTWLRPLAPEDRDDFLAAVGRSRALHGAWVSPPADAEGFDRQLARVGERYATLGLFGLDDDALLGVFNLSEIVYGNFKSAYLGFYAFAPHQGRGYMAEGLALVRVWAFERLGLHRVEANVQPDNARSIALVSRAGFVREGFSRGYLFIDGVWRDHERWAVVGR